MVRSGSPAQGGVPCPSRLPPERGPSPTPLRRPPPQPALNAAAGSAALEGAGGNRGELGGARRLLEGRGGWKCRGGAESAERVAGLRTSARWV